MTENVEGYSSRSQIYINSSSWPKDEIKEGLKKGRIITDICYNEGLHEYMVVMTSTSERQKYRWFESSDGSKEDLTTSNGKTLAEWLGELEKRRKWQANCHPTIVFKDPNDGRLLIVVTTGEDSVGYTTRIEFPLV